MKRIITLIAQDGTEIKIDTNTKITIQDTLFGENAVYGKIYNGALIHELNCENCEVTIKFMAAYYEAAIKYCLENLI